MRAMFAVSAFFGIVATAIAAQNPIEQLQLPSPEQVTLANGAAGLVAPVPNKFEIAPAPDPGCNGKKLNGAVGLSLVVDTQGRPRNITLEKPLGNDLDYLAVHLLASERFQSGLLNGAPAAVAGTVELQIEGCVQVNTDNNGSTSVSVRPRTTPEITFNAASHMPEIADLDPIDFAWPEPASLKDIPHAIAPTILNRVEAEFSDYARAHHIQGSCTYQITIDEHGLPRDFQIVHPIDPSLQQEASAAVHKYRFRPATKDGMPIRVHIFVEISFRLG